MIRTFKNSTERLFLGNLLKLFLPAIRISTRDWARKYRTLTSEESSRAGSFDPDFIPALEYVYDCMDNRLIWVIVCKKASQVGWSELTNNVIGRIIHTLPQKIQWSFPGATPAKVYSREKLKPFFNNNPILRDLINKGVAKPASDVFLFSGGWLKLVTLGSISAAKTSAVQFIGVEEPDDVRDNIKGQGDTLENVKGRQKTFKMGQKKLVYGGTPTDIDFSRVDSGYKESNQMVFKAKCHYRDCSQLSELHSDNILYDVYPEAYIDPIYGKHNPHSAKYYCPCCLKAWTDKERHQNIQEGKRYGFTDHTGAFSKGWHKKREEVEIFGFHIPELLSTLSTSSIANVAKNIIKAKKAYALGNEGLLKSHVNNTDGNAYSSGITSIETSAMVLLRSNYPEGIVPMEGLSVTVGIDVQDNRLAVIMRAWGRNNNSWLIKWEELYGDVTNEGSIVWDQLADKVLYADIPHASGKTLKVEAVTIDAADNTELVYKWVLKHRNKFPELRAAKGVRDLRFSEDPIYKEPIGFGIEKDTQARKTLAETMGVTVYQVGAHNAHGEILRRVKLLTNKDAESNLYFFNEQRYGGYEEQMTSCRKLIDTKSAFNRSIFKLIGGKRKEAMDAEKLALHANYARGIRNWTNEQWTAIENYLYKG